MAIPNPDRPGLHLISEPVHQPICNVEVEEALIGALILDPDAYSRVEGLTAEHFYSGAHREIFRAISEVHSRNQRPDLVRVVATLQDSGKLDECGGSRGISAIADRVVSTANVDQYALLVREKWARRQLVILGGEAVALARQEDSVTAISTLRSRLDALTGVSSADWVNLEDLQRDLQQECAEILQGKTRDVIPTGFYDLDAMLSGGFEPGTITLIGGRPSMGKSAIALSLASKMAKKAPVGFYSMEMSAMSLARRLAASASGVWSGAIKTMKLHREEDVEQLFFAISQLGKGRQLYMRFAQPSLDELCNDLRSAIARYGLKVVVIDHLHLLAGSEDTAELSPISNRLANLCRSTGVVMISLCQLSRSVEARTNKRPTMGDLRQSGSLEQDADSVMLLYRDEYYNPDSPDRGLAEIIIAKQRDGPIGTVKLLFEPHFCRFKNLATR